MKLLVTGAVSLVEDDLKKIAINGYEVEFLADEKFPLCNTNIDPTMVEGIICNGLFLYNQIECFSNLRFIQLTSAGFDRVPLEYINAHGIRLYGARDVYSIPMAEFTIGSVLQFYKQSAFFYRNQRLHIWEKNRELLELTGKTILIIGCGSVGKECAKRFQAFGCKVLGVARTERAIDGFNNVFTPDKMFDLLPICDVLVIAIPHATDTHHLIDSRALSSMKASSLLINISRGGIIDTCALMDALINKKILGAALDVFEDEPLPTNSPLWDIENVLITPHNSFVGNQTNFRLKEIIHDTLTREVVRK